MRNKEGNKEEDILEAAVKVFAKYGYHNSRINQIAKEAGVASGSVYLYYKNKEVVLASIFKKVWEQMYNEIFRIYNRNDLTPIDKIDYLIDIVFDIFSTDPAMATVFVNEQINLQNETELFSHFYDKFFKTGEKIIEDGIKEGSVNPDINVKVFKFFLLGGMRYLLENWAKDIKNFSLTTIRMNVKLIIKKGVLS
jgi:TetR/AcrR family fatty acid metabolism transcriptional regulator